VIDNYPRRRFVHTAIDAGYHPFVSTGVWGRRRVYISVTLYRHMDEVARLAVSRTLDSRVQATQPAPTGNLKQTVFATLVDGREVVVQHTAVGKLATEITLLQAINIRTKVPVAALLGSGEIVHPETGERRSYVICERVDGFDLHTMFSDLAPPDRRAVAQTLGVYLGALHRMFPFDRYGKVVTVAGELQVQVPAINWQDWFTTYLQAGLANLTPELTRYIPDVHSQINLDGVPRDPPAALFPWDFRPGNALLDRDTGNVTAVLDWGAPLAADPVLSFAKAEYLIADWYAPDAVVATRVAEAFYKGYAEYRPVPQVPQAYRLAAVVRSAYDSQGEITRPGYPEREGDAATAFHREQFHNALATVPERH
jgi:aminoglycoside phosphotransferase (APT) family kinase protein